MNRRAENDEERDEDAEDPYFDADQEAGKSAETDGWEDIVSRKQLHHNLGGTVWLLRLARCIGALDPFAPAIVRCLFPIRMAGCCVHR